MSVSTAKNVFVILGMARNGTSVISRGLKAIGIDLGTTLTPASKWNPKGFWEDNDVVYKVNEKVLAALNYSWDSVSVIDSVSQTSDSLSEFKKIAIGLLNQRFSTTDYWAFKDPRTVKILYFWQSIFDAAKVKDHYIIALRNPLSSAQSYQRLTQADLEHGLLLWLAHLLPAVEGTQGKDRIVVSYDLMMQNPLVQLERIKNHFALPMHSDPNEVDIYINSFLDKKLHHYECSDLALNSHQSLAIAPLCLKMYDWLLKIAKDEIDFNDKGFITAWQEVKTDFARLAPIYSYVDTLLSRNRSLKKYIYALHKSRLWKIIYPLRKIDSALRAYRKKSKLMKENDQ